MMSVKFYEFQNGKLVAEVVVDRVVREQGGVVSATPYRAETLAATTWAEFVSDGVTVAAGPVNSKRA